MTIGQNIKKLRHLHNLSQKELGQIAGVSDKAVSTWENDSKEPRMGVIQKIADHFGIQKSNIIEENGLKNYTPFQTSNLSPPTLPQLTAKDERQIANDLENMLQSLDGAAAMGDDPDDEEDRELLKASLLQAMTLSKRLAKKKFTPKKYR